MQKNSPSFERRTKPAKVSFCRNRAGTRDEWDLRERLQDETGFSELEWVQLFQPSSIIAALPLWNLAQPV
jgi:hypothetical protein